MSGHHIDFVALDLPIEHDSGAAIEAMRPTPAAHPAPVPRSGVG